MKRWPIKVAAITVVGVGAVALGQFALSNGLAGVSSVEVIGSDRVSDRQIKVASGIDIGDNALSLDLDQAREQVEAIPLVRNADVSRSGVLSIEIQVTERTPALAIQQGSVITVLDEDGVEVEGSRAGLPLLTVDQSVDLIPSVVRGSIRLRDRLTRKERSVAKLTWGPVNGLALQLGQRMVVLGDPQDMGDKLFIWRRIRNSFGKQPRKVDLSEYPRVAIS